MRQGIFKEKKGEVLLRLRVCQLLSTFPQGQLAAPRSAGAGRRGMISFISWQFQKHLPTSPSFKSGHIPQSFLDFYNPVIKTIVDKSTEYTMPCLLPVFCVQFQNGY